MKEYLYLIDLYSYYGELLTKKQQEYFEDYYYNNLSLAEISENNNVSRSAVGKALKDITNKLKYYESILKLQYKINLLKEKYKNSKELEEILKVLDY